MAPITREGTLQANWRTLQWQLYLLSRMELITHGIPVGVNFLQCRVLVEPGQCSAQPDVIPSRQRHVVPKPLVLAKYKNSDKNSHVKETSVRRIYSRFTANIQVLVGQILSCVCSVTHSFGPLYWSSRLHVRANFKCKRGISTSFFFLQFEIVSQYQTPTFERQPSTARRVSTNLDEK